MTGHRGCSAGFLACHISRHAPDTLPVQLMPLASAHDALRSCGSTGLGHHLPSKPLLPVPANSSRPYLRASLLRLPHRAALQHCLAQAAGSGPSGEWYDFVFDRSSPAETDEEAFMLDLAAGSSASSKPTATRQQLDQLFDTLTAEGGITAKQFFMQDDIEAHAKVKDIGYCYFSEDAAWSLARSGSLSLTYGNYGDPDDCDANSSVAVRIYLTAVDCNLPIHWDGDEFSDMWIDGFDPEEFADWKDIPLSYRTSDNESS